MNLDQLEALLTHLEPDDIRRDYAHVLKENPECEAMLRVYEGLDPQLAALKDLEPAPVFEKPKKKLLRNWVYGALPLAAILVLALLLGVPGALRNEALLSPTEEISAAPAKPVLAEPSLAEKKGDVSPVAVSEASAIPSVLEEEQPRFQGEVSGAMDQKESESDRVAAPSPNLARATPESRLDEPVRQEAAKSKVTSGPDLDTAEALESAEELLADATSSQAAPEPSVAPAEALAMERRAEMRPENQAANLPVAAPKPAARKLAQPSREEGLADSLDIHAQPAPPTGHVSQWLQTLRNADDVSGFAALFTNSPRLRIKRPGGAYQDRSLGELYTDWNALEIGWDEMVQEDGSALLKSSVRLVIPIKNQPGASLLEMYVVLNAGGFCEALDLRIH